VFVRHVNLTHTIVIISGTLLRNYSMDKAKNKVFEALIMQCLGENEIKRGSYQAFAKLFGSFSGKQTSRMTISQWANGKGVPSGKCGIAENLSRKYARNKADIITIQKLRPDKFGFQKQQ
jgi:hypothetical protein